MNFSILLYVGLSLAVFVALALMLRRMRAAKVPPPTHAEASHEPFAVHCRHFTQIRQVLSPDDAAFIAQRLSAPARRQWRAERRRVLRHYLAGLKEDFAGLERLARTVAVLSPQVTQFLKPSGSGSACASASSTRWRCSSSRPAFPASPNSSGLPTCSAALRRRSRQAWPRSRLAPPRPVAASALERGCVPCGPAAHGLDELLVKR